MEDEAVGPVGERDGLPRDSLAFGVLPATGQNLRLDLPGKHLGGDVFVASEVQPLPCPVLRVVEPTQFAGRDQVNPQAGKDCATDVYKQAGITDPRSQIDVAEIYVPFSWYEPMWMENLAFAPEGEGWKMTDSGATAMDGDMPINPSGGVLSSNPIGASGMIRYAEAAMQIREQAGEHQIDGVRTALGHAYGGGAQFYSMCILTREKP